MIHSYLYNTAEFDHLPLHCSDEAKMECSKAWKEGKISKRLVFYVNLNKLGRIGTNTDIVLMVTAPRLEDTPSIVASEFIW